MARYDDEWKRRVSEATKARMAERSDEDKATTNSKISAAASKPRKSILELKHWPAIKSRLIEERGRKCEECGWDQPNPFHNTIPIQVDHIDGNRKNNHPDNLRILCPNCHSMTEHYMFLGRKHTKDSCKKMSENSKWNN